MRIVFLNPVAEFGGAERSLLAWMTAARQGIPGAVLTLIVPGEGLLAERARQAEIGVVILPIPAGVAALGDSAIAAERGTTGRVRRTGRLLASLLRAGPATVSYATALRRTLDGLRPDLIHSNGLKTHVFLRLARWPFDGRRGDPPSIWHLHDFLARRPLAKKLLRWSSRRGVAGVIAVSDAVAAEARQALPRVPVHTVRNVVDLDRFRPAEGRGELLDERASLRPPAPGVIRVVLVATYARWKGQDVLLEAASLLARDGTLPPIRIFIVGGPIYRTVGSQFSLEELRARADSLGLSGSVGFIPFHPEPADLYRAADIVVHASTAPEPFGLTIVEAMACGRAVVVSRAGGASELIEDGIDAVGVHPSDPEALAGAIARLARDEQERTRLGVRARRSVEAKFDQKRLPAAVVTVYSGVRY